MNKNNSWETSNRTNGAQVLVYTTPVDKVATEAACAAAGKGALGVALRKAMGL